MAVWALWLPQPTSHQTGVSFLDEKTDQKHHFGQLEMFFKTTKMSPAILVDNCHFFLKGV